jgi:hypothetical protein
MGSPLPQGFFDLEPYVADWALATRAERYAARVDRPFDEPVAFYDAHQSGGPRRPSPTRPGRWWRPRWASSAPR